MVRRGMRFRGYDDELDPFARILTGYKSGAKAVVDPAFDRSLHEFAQVCLFSRLFCIYTLDPDLLLLFGAF